MEPIEDGERVEFVPWEQLRPRERHVVAARQRFVMITGAVCVIAIVAGWWWADRADSVPSVPDAAHGSASQTLVPLASVTTIAATARVTEADLLAVAPEASERAVAAVASEYLRAYLSDETPQIHPYGTATTPVYVEWITVTSAEVTDEFQRWMVTMRVGLLELSDDPRRLPVGEYSVFVTLDDGTVVVSVPIRRDPTELDQFVMQRQSLIEVPATILKLAAIRPEEEILGGWEAAGTWYVMVRDERGLPVAVEVGTP